jgi:hypothetical protein
LLNPKTINHIHTLLENGFSQRKTAKLADVSVSIVQRIVTGKRSNIGRAKAVFDCFANMVNSECYIPLELRGDVLRRYLDLKHRKDNQLTNS